MKTAIVLAIAGALCFASSISLALLPPCEQEDSTNCYWDASEQGNGQGKDFLDIGGILIQF